MAFLMTSVIVAAPKSYELSSPDGTVRTVVTIGDDVNYSVWKNSDQLLNPSVISMDLMDGSSYDASVKLQKVERSTVDNTLDALFYKKDKVRENYNELKLRFRTYDLIFRAYDAGVAYRFVSKSKAPFKVKGEVAEFSFPEDWNAYVPYVRARAKGFENQFWNSFENRYENLPMSSWDTERLAFLPLMVQSPQGYKINIMESDLTDYPGMYLYNSDGDSTLEAVFPRYPKDVEQGGHNMLQGVVKSREEYIAEYDGATAFPWRIVNISTEDKEMLDNDLVWLLGAPADPSADWSWVKPGKVAWDWWNDWNLTGVDFKAGVNNATYEYYIDFASRNGIEYVILDEGWAVNLEADLFKVVPEIDLERLVAYAAERNVGLVLWAGYWAFDKDMEKICEHYAKMGIKGWKVDFMDRDDQVVVDFYTRAAATAAKYRQFVDFHGGYEPSGL
ncbi:MAG: glycoside hydrolase family 97 N-terminal domain-containing protein, partial [Bacteroidales bacterium]|nr:glycoside hydrolase family 97 N-terminal domain-containing protein [Bacteroidales bacterium]